MDRKKIYTMRKTGVVWVLLLHAAIMHAESVFEFGVHGGVALLDAKTEYVVPKVGGHGGVQVYYNFLSSEVFGFRTGLTLDMHVTSIGKTNYTDHYSTIDKDNEQMDIDYSIGRLNERYQTWSVGIPVQLALTTHRFTILFGPKVVFPLSCTWQQDVQHAALSVYYPQYDNRVEESYPLAASRDFEMQQSGTIALPKVQWWLSAELSYAIPIENWSSRIRTYLMLGVYADYCLTRYSPTPSEAESLIMLSDTRDGIPLQRLLTPVMQANRSGNALVRSCAPLDAGIKISIGIAPYDPHRNAKKSCNCL